MSEIYLVNMTEVRGEDEPYFLAFEHLQDAEDFAGVRGGVEAESVTLLDNHEAKRLIDAEARTRRDEERFERMRQGDF